MELLSPAGSLEKMNIALAFGADAVYIGVPELSLRAGAEKWSVEDLNQAQSDLSKWNTIKPRKLYGAINRYVHQKDIDRIEQSADSIGSLPFDAFIVSDLGVARQLQKRFPHIQLHLSTQANCTNSEAARMYYDLGFTRFVAARELTLDEIAAIKQALPEMEIEVFVHGAICIAYAGRCLISSWLTGRSANQGACTHSCRWYYREFEEKKRPGTPAFSAAENDGYTTIFSPRDICMIDHLQQLKDAGIDSIKIEGRMKSSYYVGAVTAAYHSELHKPGSNTASIQQLLLELPHRGYDTGMYFGPAGENIPAWSQSSEKNLNTRFAGIIHHTNTPGKYRLEVKNSFSLEDTIDVLSPGTTHSKKLHGQLIDEKGKSITKVVHGKPFFLVSNQSIADYSLIRTIPG